MKPRLFSFPFFFFLFSCGDATPLEQACARVDECFGLIAGQDAAECAQSQQESFDRSTDLTPERREACENYFVDIANAASCSAIPDIEPPGLCFFVEIPED